MGLREKTANGLAWNFTGNIVGQVISFIIGIILARLLSPYEYGLIGMVTIFIALSHPFINSGFSQALIRKERCSQLDFSTVFYFNLLVGIIFFILLFFGAPYISRFFHEPQLLKITRVIGFIIIIDAASLIQITILTREINFKRQSQISIFSSLVSGIIGVGLAYFGYGVWSLVYKTIIQHSLSTILLWYFGNWRPLKAFSRRSFGEMFAFGSNLLISGIIDKIHYNVYNLVIAKFFSAIELGLYSRADMFKNLVSSSGSEIVARVALPTLASVQSEPERMVNHYRRILTSTMFITSILLLAIAGSAESIIITLIGDKWFGSVIYLRLLCFVGVFYPLIVMTRTLLYAYGKGRLSLMLDIMSKIIAIPAILIGIFFGIKAMIAAMIAVSIVEFLLNAFFSGRLSGYALGKQIRDLLPIFIVSLIIGGCLFFLDYLLKVGSLITLLCQICLGFCLTVGISELFKFKEYIFIKEIALSWVRSAREKFKCTNNN